MITYPIEILRAAFFSLINPTVFVRFSFYMKNRRPVRIKAKISQLWASPERGLMIEFRNVYWNRKQFPRIKIPTRDIRWVTCPFDQDKFEEQCRLFQKKLTAGSKKIEQFCGDE